MNNHLFSLIEAKKQDRDQRAHINCRAHESHPRRDNEGKDEQSNLDDMEAAEMYMAIQASKQVQLALCKRIFYRHKLKKTS